MGQGLWWGAVAHTQNGGLRHWPRKFSKCATIVHFSQLKTTLPVPYSSLEASGSLARVQALRVFGTGTRRLTERISGLLAVHCNIWSNKLDLATLKPKLGCEMYSYSCVLLFCTSWLIAIFSWNVSTVENVNLCTVHSVVWVLGYSSQTWVPVFHQYRAFTPSAVWVAVQQLGI